MARRLVSTWQEVLKLLEGCKVKGPGKLESAGVLLIPLESSNEEPYILRIASVPQVGLNGSMVNVSGAFTIDLLAPETEAELKLGGLTG